MAEVSKVVYAHKDGRKTYQTLPTPIYWDGGLTFEQGERLATKAEYELGDRCVGSIYEALDPYERVRLAEGLFRLDFNLDLLPLRYFSFRTDGALTDDVVQAYTLEEARGQADVRSGGNYHYFSEISAEEAADIR